MRLGKNYNIINDAYKMILNSCEYGVPQIRKRIFLIGIRKDINYDIKKIFSDIKKTHYAPDCKNNEKIKKKFVTVRDAISDLPLKPGQ